MEPILNSKKYWDLRTFYEYSEEGRLPPLTGYSSKKLIKCCKLLKNLIHDEELWDTYSDPNRPLYGIRIRNTISSNVWKTIIIIHKRHVELFLRIFKSGYVRLMKTYTFGKSQNQVKVVVVEKNRDAARSRSGTENLFPPLSGLRITRSSRSAEDTISSPTAQNAPAPATEHLVEWLPRTSLTPSLKTPSQTITELPSQRAIPVPSPVPTTEETSTLPHEVLSETIAAQSLAPRRNENLVSITDVEPPIRPLQNLDLIEVFEEGTLEPAQHIGMTKQSEISGSRKGAEKTNEMSSRDEIIAFLLESGLGFEGYEHVESMDQLQRALEKELFSPSAGALADQISRRTKPAGGSSSSEDFQRVIQVQADVHHLPRELRSPEQSIEPNIVIREQTPLRVDSQLMVQAEVHVPSRDTEIGIAETIAQSEQMDTHQRQVQIPLLDRGLDTGGEEGVRRIDAQGIQITDQELWDQLNAITTLEEVRPLQQGENADKHGREVLDQRFWDQFNLITTEEENVTEKSKDTSISGIRVRPIHELFDAIDRIEQEAALEQPNTGTPVQYTETGTTEFGTGHWEAPPPNQDRVTVAPAIQSVADLLIHGVETRSPTHPAVIEIRSPPQGIIRAQDMDLLLPLEQRSPSLRLTQPIQQSTPRVSRQPEIASEQAETRSSPQTRPFPRIRELLEQNASLVRAPTPRVRKKKICYSEAVLTKKNKKTIKPQNLISYARRIDLWQESNCCPCLELFSLNYDQSYDAGARNLDYFREPFEELPPDYNFIGNLICHLFEQDEQDIDGEDAEAIRISDLRASIAAPERLRSIMKTSIRHSLHVDDRTKKSLLPVDQGRPSLPEIQPPPDLPEIRDVSRNIPNISNVLMEKSLEEPQIVPQQPILGHTSALEEPIVGPKTRSRSLAQSGSLAVSEIRENTLLTTSRREAISTVPELTTEVEQQRALMPENDGPLLTNIQPQNVVQMEKEEEEPEVTPRRKRISVPEVAGNLASLWLNNVEKVNFTDLCPIGATNRFTAACTFSALLTLHRMKLITLEQEQGNIAPKFLTIERS